MGSPIMTPGSGAADAVQQILQRRRDEQRQMMLDRLGIEQYRSSEDQRNKDYALKLHADSRASDESKAQILESNARRMKDEVDALPEGEFDTAPLHDSNSELYNYLLNHGRIGHETITPKVGTSTDFQAPKDATPDQLETIAKAAEKGETESVGPPQTREFYLGSNKHQESEIERKRVTDFLQSHPDLAKTNPDLLQDILMQNSGINVSQLPDSLTGPAPSVTMLPPGFRGHKDLRRGESVIEGNYPPQPNASNSSRLWQLTGPDGKETSFIGTSQDVMPFVAQGYRIRQGNDTVDQTHGLVPATAWDKLRVVRTAPNMTSDQRAQGTQQAIANIKSIAVSNGASPQVMADLDAIMRDVDRFNSSGQPLPKPEDLINSIPNLPDADRQQLTSLLYGFYGTYK